MSEQTFHLRDIRIREWILLLHRILWGYDRLTYIDEADTWLPLDFDINRFLRICAGQEELC